MRRFCTFLIVALLLVCLLSTALAEVDLTNMTIEELLALRQEVDNAIFEKDGAVILQPGTYEAGKDIAPGSYDLIFHKNARPFSSGQISVYVSAEAMHSYESDYNDYYLQLSILERNAENGHKIEEADKPEKLDEGKYLTMNISKSFDAGASYRITIEEGQVLFIEYNSHEVLVTIQQVKGLFMD